MNRLTKLGALAVSLGAFSLTTHAQLQLIDMWDFAAADSNLRPSEVAGSLGSGLAFNGDGAGQFTNGSALRVSHDSTDAGGTGGANSHIDLTNLNNFGNYHTWRVEYVISGWDFDGDDTNRRLSAGFVEGNGSFNFAANASIRYFADEPDPLTLRGEAFGTGASGGSGAGGDSVGTTGSPIAGWTPLRTDPITLRVDHTHDPVNDVFLYSIYYDDGSGFVTFFEDLATSSDRTKNYVRIGAFGTDWGNHYIDIESVSLSAIPEPSTYAAIFGGLALLGAFVYRRRVRK